MSNITLNKFGWTALHAACYFQRLELIKHFLNFSRADPNFSNPNGWHSLIFSVMGGGSREIINFLVNETHVRVEHQDRVGRNALMYAESIQPGGEIGRVLERKMNSKAAPEQE